MIFGEGGIVQMFQDTIANVQFIIDSLSWDNFIAAIAIRVPDAIRLLGGIAKMWFETLMPASLKVTYDFVNDNLVPIIEILRKVIGGDSESVYSAIVKLGDKLLEYLSKDGALGKFLTFLTEPKKGLIWALGQILDILWRPGGFIEGVTTIASVVGNAAKAWGDLVRMIDQATAAAMPYIGQSPSPLEKGIVGATHALPDFTAKMREFTKATGASFPVTTARPVAGQAQSYDYSRSYQGSATVGPNYFNTPIDVATIEIIATKAVQRALKGA
jgi:hypothetical protein